MRNKVYWITDEWYDNIPLSENWKTEDYFMYSPIMSFAEKVNKAYYDMFNNGISHYAIVIDTEDEDKLKLCHKYFISNNILNIRKSYVPDRVKKQIEWILSDFGMNNKDEIDNTFFCSDTHFYHKNIIQYCDRPWHSEKKDDSSENYDITDDDVLQMNECIIENWNSVVPKDGIVYHLGDFCLGPNQKENIPNLVSRLNGKIHLILGNHDHNSMQFYYDAGFYRVYDKPIVWNDFFILSHAPVQWVRSGSAYANLFGHVHNQEMYKHCTLNTFNCCVEVNDYKPIPFAELKKKMSACQKTS